MEFGLLWAAVTAFVALWLAIRIQARTDPRLPHEGLFDRALTAAVVGLFLGRLAAMILTGTNPIANPADIVIVRGGVNTAVATVGAIGYLAISTRGRFPAFADALGPPALIGLAGWHAGCVFRSACLGLPTDLPWAMTQAGSEIGRHPTELYAVLLLILGAAVLWWLRSRESLASRVGLIGGLAFAWVSFSRLVTEPLRPSLTNDVMWWYAAGLLAGLILAAVATLKPREGMSHR